MSPNDIADHALLTISRWQREAFTPQMHADHLLRIYQQRRCLPPAMRLADCPALVPDEDADYDSTLDLIRPVMAEEATNV